MGLEVLDKINGFNPSLSSLDLTVLINLSTPYSPFSLQTLHDQHTQFKMCTLNSDGASLRSEVGNGKCTAWLIKSDFQELETYLTSISNPKLMKTNICQLNFRSQITTCIHTHIIYIYVIAISQYEHDIQVIAQDLGETEVAGN